LLIKLIKFSNIPIFFFDFLNLVQNKRKHLQTCYAYEKKECNCDEILNIIHELNKLKCEELFRLIANLYCRKPNKAEERLLSFKPNWSVSFLQARDLANNGFYYTGVGDIVRCCFCSVEIGSWTETDSNFALDHERFTTDKCCPYIQPPNICCFPDYFSLDARMLSFSKWPLQISQKPFVMSVAGFFYTGSGDEVICFSCGCKADNWLSGQSPFSIHNKLNKDCLFLQNAPDFETSISNKEYDDYRFNCKVCYVNEANVLIIPCKHLTICSHCLKSLSNCPICRESISSSLKCFRS
jgi:baculoviral IAP repeat-containing protein 7/8